MDDGAASPVLDCTGRASSASVPSVVTAVTIRHLLKRSPPEPATAAAIVSSGPAGNARTMTKTAAPSRGPAEKWCGDAVSRHCLVMRAAWPVH